jgi:hypothetical protein
MVAKTWGWASTAIGPVDSSWGEAAAREDGTAAQGTRNSSSVPIQLHRADAKLELILEGMADLVSPIFSAGAAAYGQLHSDPAIRLK